MKLFDKLSILLRSLIIKFFYLMFILVIINIFLRYVLNTNFIFMQELVMYLHAFMFLFGISICLKEDTHVRIDVISNKLTKKTRDIIEVVGCLVFIIPFCIFVMYESTSMIMSSWIIMESSSEPGGLPLIYILKSSIYFFAMLLLIEVINKLTKTN